MVVLVCWTAPDINLQETIGTGLPNSVIKISNYLMLIWHCFNLFLVVCLINKCFGYGSVQRWFVRVDDLSIVITNFVSWYKDRAMSVHVRE